MACEAILGCVLNLVVLTAMGEYPTWCPHPDVRNHQCVRLLPGQRQGCKVDPAAVATCAWCMGRSCLLDQADPFSVACAL